MMTKLKRMVVVDVWLRSGQSLMDYADNLGLDVGTFLGWIMDYGQPADLSTWIPVRMLDGHPDRQRFEEDRSGEYLQPDVPASRGLGSHWIPVVIQGRS